MRRQPRLGPGGRCSGWPRGAKSRSLHDGRSDGPAGRGGAGRCGGGAERGSPVCGRGGGPTGPLGGAGRSRSRRKSSGSVMSSSNGTRQKPMRWAAKLMDFIVEPPPLPQRHDRRSRRSGASGWDVYEKISGNFCEGPANARFRRPTFAVSGAVTGPQSRAATPFGDPRHSLGALIMRRAGLLDFLSPASQQIVGTIQAVAGSAPDPSKQVPSRPNALWHNLTALAVVRKTSQCAGTGRRQVKMGQVGMSGWFCHIVLRLVENREQGHRSAPYGSSPTGS